VLFDKVFKFNYFGLRIQFNSISLKIFLWIKGIIIDWIFKNILEITSDNSAHPRPVLDVIIILCDVPGPYNGLFTHIIDFTQIVSKVVSKFINVHSSGPVYLYGHPIFKETIVAGEDDWIYTHQNFIGRVSSLSKVQIRILLIHSSCAVVENTQVSLADAEVSRDLTH
jgi:hypothetical protein